MRMSDLVSSYIIKMLEESGGNAQIQRNELAQSLGCVPSQINYVITSRFTQEQGYIVESKRGGGGYIKITKIEISSDNAINRLLNCIGDEIDYLSAKLIVEELLNQEIITIKEAKIILSALSDRMYVDMPIIFRDVVRAKIFKNMLLNLL